MAGPSGSRRVALAWAVALAVAASLVAALVAVAGFMQPSADARSWTVAVVFTLLGLRFAAQVPDNTVGWLMLAIGGSAALFVLAVAGGRSDLPAWFGSWIWLPAYTLLAALALVFPTGRVLSPRWRWAAAADVAGTVLMAVGLGTLAWPAPRTFWDDATSGRFERGWPTLAIAVGLGLVVLAALAGVAALAIRWWREPAQRPLFGWATACAALTLVAAALEAAVTSSFWSLAALALPVAAVVAVLRYGLYDIDLIIHRSLLYGLLSVTLLTAYAAVAYTATFVVPDQARAAAAVAVVLLVFPLRTVLQRRVDRWLYGDRAEPYRALTGLGRRLGGSLDVDEVLPTIAEHVSSALRAPYVRASVDSDSPRGAVAVGRSRGWPTRSVPLTFRGGRIGEIVVETRAPEERYSSREERLLDALAGAAGAAAHAVVLTEDLRVARERLVLAREEERRRLRRDLHDGVGAGLAGALMQLKTASRRLDDAERAGPPLASAMADLVALTGEVRRVVDGLGPTDLDRGLAPALRQVALPYEGSTLAIEVSVDDAVKDLPAALEVAAYHIAQEALANVARHAEARHCRIGVSLDGGLRLEVADDGLGLDAASKRGRRGMGLTSMQERAAELGGVVDIAPGVGGGTRVNAWLPLPGSVKAARREP